MNRERLKPAVVLAADRTLSARYSVLFEGILGTMQTTKLPEPVVRHLLAPAVKTDRDGRASAAPLGLRRVEASLIRDAGLTARDVVCTTPRRLGQLLGPWVKLVMFSSSDPLGRGMSNTTTSNFMGGRLYTSLWTRRMLRAVARAKRRFGFKVAAGGAGAWQLTADGGAARQLGIDIVFDGYFERSGPALVRDILAGRPVEGTFVEKETAADLARPIMAPSVMGAVELSRGCGKGCRFCTMSAKKMEHLSLETIVADIETNASSGVRCAVSASEDFLRYGSSDGRPDFDRLCGLFEAVRGIDSLRLVQLDHVNVASVLQLSAGQLEHIASLLRRGGRTGCPWVNMGVESASGRLVKANCPQKIRPFRTEDWQQMVHEAVERISRAGFFPVLSVVLGMPGETAGDVDLTINLVNTLARRRAAVFPIFYEPPNGNGRFTMGDMTGRHLRLFRTCYEINFGVIPKLIWDNQTAAGVPLPRKAFYQALGRLQVAYWRKTFGQAERRIGQAAGGGEN